MSTPVTGTPAKPPPASEGEPGLRRKTGVTIVTAIVLLGVVWFSVSVLPRWWSHRVGDQVDGDLTTGAILGFMYGFFAMLLPLIVVVVVLRFARRSVRAWVIGGLVALLLASPNLITLGITVGRGNAAHAADRTLDVEAPYFRGGMAIGAGVALALVCLYAWTTASRRRAHRRAERRLAGK